VLISSIHWARVLPAFQALTYGSTYNSYFCGFSASEFTHKSQLDLVLTLNNEFFFCRFEMQISLTKSVWIELFTIGLVQWKTAISLPSILNALLEHIRANCSSSRLTTIGDQVSKLRLFIGSADVLNLDNVEWAALKALAMFSPGKFILLLFPFNYQLVFNTAVSTRLLTLTSSFYV